MYDSELCADSLVLNLMVDDHSRRIEALEATVKRLMEIVKALQPKSSLAEPPLKQAPPPPPVPPRCPIMHLSTSPPSPSSYEHYGNAYIFPDMLSPPPLPPPLPPLRDQAPPPVPPRCPLVNSTGQIHFPPSLTPAAVPQPQLPPKLSLPSKCLPSSAIDKTKLKSAQDVISENANLASQVGSMTTLAVVLARETFFGEEVMGQCTAKGHGDKPGLPHQELMELKGIIKGAYPQYWNSPHAFEPQWSKCSEQISQACKRIRNRLKRKNKD